MKIKDTIAHNDKSCVQLCALSDDGENKNKVKLTVTYDMGWQNRLSGRRYDFSSGHELLIGRICKGIIGMVFYSNSF